MKKIRICPQAARSTASHVIAAVTAAVILTSSPASIFADKNQPPGTPRTAGQWSDAFDLGIIAINASLLQTGKVLFWQFIGGPNGGSLARLWDPSGTITDVSIPYEHDVFCSGQTHLADGRLMAVGGVTWGHSGSEVGVTYSDFFDPVTETWSPGPEMAYPRWYPSVTEAADGSIYVFGGQAAPGILINQTERYDPVTNTFSVLPSTADNLTDIYSRTILLPDGRIFMGGQNAETDALDLTTNTWSFVGNFKSGARLNGQAIILPTLNQVLAIGGGHGPPEDATATAEIIDFSQPTPSWQYTASMTYPRQYGNAVLLPDGNILVVGGARNDKYIDPAGPAELYDTTTQTWRVLATAPVMKCHHSTLILLPDGRVWSAGGDGYIPDRTFAQIYSPPYLFRGQRPIITSAPTSVTYNQAFSVLTPNARQITKAALLKLGSATHAGNFDQRYIPLSFVPKSGKLQVIGPVNSAQAPPGYYMLFIIDNGGIPSVASMVLVN